MKTFTHRFAKYGVLERPELISLIITALVAGFYVSFDNWGVDGLDYVLGMQNLVMAIFAILLIMGSIVFAQKALGVYFGYQTSYKYSWIGLVIGFFTTGFSAGALPFFIPGAAKYKLIRTARLGKFLPHYKYSEMWLIAGLAVLIPLLYATVFGSLYVATELTVFRHVTVAAILIAVFSLIPLPNFADLSKWGAHGVTDVKLYKNLHHGTFGYDLATFGFTAYIILVVITLIFALLLTVFQIFSILLSVLLAVVVIAVYRSIILYLGK